MFGSTVANCIGCTLGGVVGGGRLVDLDKPESRREKQRVAAAEMARPFNKELAKGRTAPVFGHGRLRIMAYPQFKRLFEFQTGV